MSPGRRFSGLSASSTSNKQRFAAFLAVLTVCWLLVSKEETALLKLHRTTLATVDAKNQGSTAPTGPVFHVVFTVPNFSTLNLRCLESIFFFHPTAHLKIHSNAFYGGGSASSLDDTSAAHSKKEFASSIQALRDLGYYIEILPYSAAEVLDRAVRFDETQNTTRIDTAAAADWSDQLSTFKEEKYWFSNEANLLRLCLLYTEGGIYLDTDVILVRPMVPTRSSTQEGESGNNDDRRDEGLVADNTMSRDDHSFHNAVLKFQHAGNPFLGAAITDFLREYNGTVWGNNGPWVFGRLAETHSSMICPDLNGESPERRNEETTENDEVKRSCWLQPLPEKAFQPINWPDWKEYCFDDKKSPVNDKARQIFTARGVHAIHLNNHLIGKELARHEYLPHSVCDYILHEFCILCTDVGANTTAADVKKRE